LCLLTCCTTAVCVGHLALSRRVGQVWRRQEESLFQFREVPTEYSIFADLPSDQFLCPLPLPLLPFLSLPLYRFLFASTYFSSHLIIQDARKSSTAAPSSLQSSSILAALDASSHLDRFLPTTSRAILSIHQRIFPSTLSNTALARPSRQFDLSSRNSNASLSRDFFFWLCPQQRLSRTCLGPRTDHSCSSMAFNRKLNLIKLNSSKRCVLSLFTPLSSEPLADAHWSNP